MKLLDSIKTPSDIKKLSVEQLPELAAELRQEIISSVSKTGGHLATNLGSVELTIALHYLYDIGKDKLVWDVSNQTYSHKILTGRRERMDTLRQYKGLAGFSKRDESPYDDFGAGHASTSISAALGFAVARDNAGLDHKVIAIIGDGAMTGGLAYEGLNNAGSCKNDILVIVNDNSWSISKNVGAMSRYLTNILTDEKFNKLRNEIWEMTGRFKRRDKIRSAISNIEDSIKNLLVPGMLFQRLGFRYFGPIDGHDLPLLIKTLQNLRNLRGPIMLHVATVKGKGYKPAEGNPTKYHGVGKFDKVTGQMESKSSAHPNYTQVFGQTMVELAAKDERVVAITAAMAPGTGLVEFAAKYPERFFDVGIAEGHAGTFAAGLAAGGARPYLVIYSTFMQRAYDMVMHDIALQRLPVVLCMDRAGLVGSDGPTHHGVYDLSYLSTIPGITVAVPKDGNELRSMLHYTVEHDLTEPVAIRYPRESVPVDMTEEIQPIEWGKWETFSPLGELVLMATGTMVTTARNVAATLEDEGYNVSVVNVRFVKPFDFEMMADIRDTARYIVTLEENALKGGMGQLIAEYLLSHGYDGGFKAFGVPDRYITHGSRDQLLKEIGLDEQSVAGEIISMISQPVKGGNGILRKLGLRKSGEGKKKTSDSNADLFASHNNR